MEDNDRKTMELATHAFLELTPSLREQIKLLIPVDCTPDQSEALFRQKAWSELCLAAKQAGKEPMEYSRQIIKLYKAEPVRGATVPEPGKRSI
ncbi:hypothetical protein [Pseudomonas pseudonitroreducens]|uniref:hypothetical protein n=1 Tax=Pseudomonas pseudonitroreducens TaxID=2892326 RepID=UPI001F20CBBB|nr:hypothetical protein [Pseudomonas pseudonitroreducens]